jgi:NAD(P)-dependent dehydrogenase (short-subunit alcohol dehydrogenase family)
MAERFKGKIVIVTGSASGIGEATARRFVAEGAKVAWWIATKTRWKRSPRVCPPTG